MDPLRQTSSVWIQREIWKHVCQYFQQARQASDFAIPSHAALPSAVHSNSQRSVLPRRHLNASVSDDESALYCLPVCLPPVCLWVWSGDGQVHERIHSYLHALLAFVYGFRHRQRSVDSTLVFLRLRIVLDIRHQNGIHNQEINWSRHQNEATQKKETINSRDDGQRSAKQTASKKNKGNKC